MKDILLNVDEKPRGERERARRSRRSSAWPWRIWSASGCIAVFMRASNATMTYPRAGRSRRRSRSGPRSPSPLSIRPVITALGVVPTGPVAERSARSMGLGVRLRGPWRIAKRPVLLPMGHLHGRAAVLGVPERETGLPRGHTRRGVGRGPAGRSLGPGSCFYVASFPPTTGPTAPTAGVIVFLIWPWISNIVVPLGAELNPEDELQPRDPCGVHPEDKEPYLPPRDEPKDDERLRTPSFVWRARFPVLEAVGGSRPPACSGAGRAASTIRGNASIRSAAVAACVVHEDVCRASMFVSTRETIASTPGSRVLAVDARADDRYVHVCAGSATLVAS